MSHSAYLVKTDLHEIQLLLHRQLEYFGTSPMLDAVSYYKIIGSLLC